MQNENDGSDEDVPNLDVNQNLAFAREIMEGKRRVCTRVMYRRKIEIFATWIRANRPDAYDSENKKIILPLNPDVIVEFMAKISIVSDRKTGAKRQTSVSVIGSYRRSIAMLYEENDIIFDDPTVLALNKFAGGYQRLVADKKLNGEMKIQEGKSPITFQAYNFVAKHALIKRSDHNRGCFAHLFLILCWTLMARSSTCLTLHVSSGIKSVAAIKTQKRYLSKSKAIMNELANILKNLESITKVSDLYEMNYELSRAKFSESYLLFVKKVYRTDDDVVLDNMRIGELKYNTLYDNWKKLTSKKRVRPETDDNEAS
jgi:hypothetical protein